MGLPQSFGQVELAGSRALAALACRRARQSAWSRWREPSQRDGEPAEAPSSSARLIVSRPSARNRAAPRRAAWHERRTTLRSIMLHPLAADSPRSPTSMSADGPSTRRRWRVRWPPSSGSARGSGARPGGRNRKATRALVAAGLDVVAVEPQAALRERLAASIGGERVREGSPRRSHFPTPRSTPSRWPTGSTGSTRHGRWRRSAGCCGPAADWRCSRPFRLERRLLGARARHAGPAGAPRAPGLRRAAVAGGGAAAGGWTDADERFA